MIKTEFNKNKDGYYRYLVHCLTGSRPVILLGNPHKKKGRCLDELKEAGESIRDLRNVSFTSNKKGYRFSIFSTSGQIVGTSPFCSTQRRMKNFLTLAMLSLSGRSVPEDKSTCHSE